MQLIWLQAFVTVVETGSVVRAAIQLGRPQSRVSAYLAQLEDDVGATLIDRGRRPLAPTVAGDLFLGHAREALRAIDQARVDLEHLSGRRYGTVRLACIPSVAGTYAPSLIDRFSRAEPSIAIQMLEMATSTIAQALLDRRADLAVLPAAYIDHIPELAAEELWTEPLRVVMAASHRLARSEEVTTEQIASETIVTAGSAEGGRGLSPEIAPLFAHHETATLSTRRVASPHTLVALVRRGGAVGITNLLALELTGREGLAVLPIGAPGATRRMVVAWRRGADRPSHVEVLREFIAASAPPPVGERSRGRRP